MSLSLWGLPWPHYIKLYTHDTFYLLSLLYCSPLYYWLLNIEHVLLIYLLYLLLPTLEHKFTKCRDLSMFFSLLYPQLLEEFLLYDGHSINIC